jgi:hypothetical protein
MRSVQCAVREIEVGVSDESAGVEIVLWAAGVEGALWVFG